MQESNIRRWKTSKAGSFRKLAHGLLKPHRSPVRFEVWRLNDPHGWRETRGRLIAVSPSRIGAAVGSTLKNERFSTPGVFCFVFTHNRFLKNLNARFRRVRRETDVISFSYINSGATPRVSCSVDAPLADIYISEEKAAQNARRFNEPLERELLRLVIHGVLHALGYTDYEPKAKKKMWSRQERALSKC